MKSKLINKIVDITDKNSIYYNEWGVIKKYDGDVYYIAIANGVNSIPVFDRSQFKVSYKRIENK